MSMHCSASTTFRSNTTVLERCCVPVHTKSTTSTTRGTFMPASAAASRS